jgi:hypothetical protein
VVIFAWRTLLYSNLVAVSKLFALRVELSIEIKLQHLGANVVVHEADATCALTFQQVSTFAKASVDTQGARGKQTDL